MKFSNNLNIKTLSAILLASAVLLQVSCGDTGTISNYETDSYDSNAVDTAEQTTSTEELKDDLPELDFGGAEVNISCRGDEDTIMEIAVDSENGELINDAIFRRNLSVEERLNVKINAVPGEGWVNYNNTLTKIRASIQSGDSDLDLIAGWSARIPSLAAEGLFVDLNTVPYIDKSRQWWNQDMVSNLAVNNKLFFLTGDIAITGLSAMYVFYYNKDIGAAYGVENLYDSVFDHAWTLEKMRTVAAKVYSDLNGDGVKGAEDLFGLGIPHGGNVCDGFIEASDYNFYKRTSDGGYELNTDYSMVIDIGERLYDLYFNSEGVYTVHEYKPESTDMIYAFRDGKLMLYTEWLGLIQEAQYNDMADEFGILPYPLMTDDQEEYRTFVQNAVAIWCVPITAKDIEMNGAVMEALAAESCRSVIPAYFETAMKVKYSRDNESSRILDIMRSGAHLDFGIIYNESLGSPYYCFREVLGKPSSDFASYLAKKEANYQKQLEKILQSFG